MNDKWLEASQKVVPVVIDYVIETCDEGQPIETFAETHKDLIKARGLLLFIEGTWMQIDFEGYLEHLKESNY